MVDTNNGPSSTNKNAAKNTVRSVTDNVALEFKGSIFTLTILCLRTTDLEWISREIKKKINIAPRFFKNAPIIIDLKDMKDREASLDFVKLKQILHHQHQLVPMGVRHGTAQHNEQALQAGLGIIQGSPVQIRENDREQGAFTLDGTEDQIVRTPTKTMTNPIRSGQQIYAKGGDLIVLAAVNAGAEILADGNIHVYAPLRGRALAGIQGDVNARIYCQQLEAELVSIAGNYRIFEDQIPDNLRSQPVQIYLDGDHLKIEAL